MINYLIELSVIHVTLTLGYWLLLRNERQYAQMRLFLVGATVLSLVIPLVKLPKLFDSAEVAAITTVEKIPFDTMTIAPTANVSTWYYDVLIWMYFAISVFFLIKFLKNVFSLYYLERHSTYEKYNDLSIRNVRDIKGSFTFFNWIFLSEEIDKNHQDYEVIVKHEKAHVSLGHSYELIFFELFKICFWWLPTVWLINKEIKTIHEYQADAYVLNSYSVDRYSSILISSTLKINGLSLASSFHDGLIIKRLKAMKQKTEKLNLWKIGTLSVLCASLFIALACSEEKRATQEIGDQSNDIESKTDDRVLLAMEDWAQYPGGIEALYKYVMTEIRYPKEARTNGVEGRIFVQFVVDKDGSLSDVQTVKGIGGGCDEEGKRVLKNAPSFQPASQRGRPVKVRMLMPITFKLNEGKSNPDNSTQGIVIVDEVRYAHIDLKVEANYSNGEWSGTVYDEEGHGLPGANVIVAGTTSGTASDLDGTFKIKADESKDLMITFVGYQGVKLEGKKQ
ncbi:MAG: TonB family protein [Cyclobacteriaceae bacterium]|jgi:TonB family protein